ncbi:MAG: isocitrate/isopropylmalate dehydrogenase family protein [Promethearchaeota archaeon]|nr:MAG: isocitrate/isopropylmalate dehydrogenase family protein [Candidatus Lokiarchaeota archaeon]
MKKIISITKGDGVGPEVVDEGIKILKTLSNFTEFEFEFQDAPAGGAIWKKHGESLPEKSFEIIKNSDALLFGAIGIPGLPQGAAEIAILKIRQGLDLYVNLRPIKLYNALRDRCPLKEEYIGNGIDITFVRENTEDVYANIGGIMKDEVATNLMIYTRKGCERIINYAFEFAKKHNHNKITSVDKANILRPSQLWRKIFHEIATKYPSIKTEDIYVDAFCQWLIRTPYAYQTVVTGNMFGDIISDEAAFLIGSLGMASSGNIHPGQVSMYEPIHGSAPDIAGKNIANPIGTILSVKLMMEESFNSNLGKEIEMAVEQALNEGRTVDIKNPKLKSLSTIEMGDLIAEKLKSLLKK